MPNASSSVPRPLPSPLLLLLPLSILLLVPITAPYAEAHQLFNSDEQKIGGYRIQVATDPEIPGPGNPTRLQVVITDSEGNDLIDVMAGVKIFKDDVLIDEFVQQIYRTGHIDLEYTFPESGLYLVEVDVVDIFGKEIYAKFNIGIIQTFGHIFFTMVILGVSFPPVVLAVIYISKRRKTKQQQLRR